MTGLLAAFQSLSITSRKSQPAPSSNLRPFSSTPITRNWLTPRRGESSKSRKGRPRVPTGGSVRGTTLVWGDYGIRLRDHGKSIPPRPSPNTPVS